MSAAKTITVLTFAALIGGASAAITASADPADAAVLPAAEEAEWRQGPLFETVLEGPLDAILYLTPAERVAVVAGAFYATTPTAP